LTIPAFETSDGQFYKFQTITYVPIETRALDLSLLSQEEIDWLNAYHKDVFERLSKRVDGELLAYLEEVTKPIQK
jgi:Xaa-Pro aminopeptidase